MDNSTQYITSELSTVEKDFFEYLIRTFPEEVKSIRGNDNIPIYKLIEAIAKALGNSRELILNLKNSHDIKATIQDINTTELSHIKNNNFKLLLLMLNEIKRDIDFNKVNELSYLNEIETNLNLYKDNYSIIKSRGSNYGMFNLVQNFREIYPSLYDSKFYIAEGHEGVHKLTLSGILSETNIEVLGDIAFDNLLLFTGLTKEQASEFINEEDGPIINEDWNEDYSDLYKIRTDHQIYKELMKIKPAGANFLVVIKAPKIMQYIPELEGIECRQTSPTTQELLLYVLNPNSFDVTCVIEGQYTEIASQDTQIISLDVQGNIPHETVVEIKFEKDAYRSTVLTYNVTLDSSWCEV